MYQSCIFCHHRFRRNDVFEHLPIAQRIAYDLRRGRLWAICHRCAGWNLVPFEERWEAIEECERAFERTTLLVSGEELTLARVVNDVELIRVGSPGRQEFAAWRYGDELLRRRRRRLTRIGSIAAGTSIGGGTLAVLAPWILAAVGAGAFVVWRAINNLEEGEPTTPPLAVLHEGDGTKHEIYGGDLSSVRLGRPNAGRADWVLSVGDYDPYRVTGSQALTALARLMPLINRNGSGNRDREVAVDLLDSVGCGEALLGDWRTHHRNVAYLSRSVRVALEIAAQEEAERVAMAGEVFFLEEAWRQAETLAAIADDLLLPASVRGAYERLRSRSSSRQ